MTFAKILLGVDNRRNKQKKKGKGKKASDKYQNRITKKHSAPITSFLRKKKVKRKKKNDDIKRENRKDSKRKL